MAKWLWCNDDVNKTRLCRFVCTRSTWLILGMPNAIGTQIAESISLSRNTENLDWMLVIQNTSQLVPFVGQSAGEKLNQVITIPAFPILCFCSNLSFAWLNFPVNKMMCSYLILFSLCLSFLILNIVLYNFFVSSRLVFDMEANKVSLFV